MLPKEELVPLLSPTTPIRCLRPRLPVLQARLPHLNLCPSPRTTFAPIPKQRPAPRPSPPSPGVAATLGLQHKGDPQLPADRQQHLWHIKLIGPGGGQEGKEREEAQSGPARPRQPHNVRGDKMAAAAERGCRLPERGLSAHARRVPLAFPPHLPFCACGPARDPLRMRHSARLAGQVRHVYACSDFSVLRMRSR